MSLRRCEHEEQVMLIRVCKMHEGKYPELKLLHAIPNGGHRHIAVASKLKAEGVKHTAMMLVGPFISLATYYVANGNEAMSGFTTHALFFPGFVLFYSGFGGIVATLSSQYRKP